MLAVIIIVAISIRLNGANFGLPFLYHPDEPRYVESAYLLFTTRDLNPGNLPDLSSSSFVYVINALAMLPFYLHGKVMGIFNTPWDIPTPTMLAMGVGRIVPSGIFLLHRLVTVTFGVTNVFLVFLVGRRWAKDTTIGLLAAAYVAISPTNVSLSRFVTPDTFVVFFALLLLLAAVQLWENEGELPYILAGIALGCMASTKISGILSILPFLVAHFYRKRLSGLLDWRLLLFGVMSAIAFVATTPFILGNAADVFRDIASEGQHYARGHPGMEGNTTSWYMNYMWQTAGPIYILAAFEIIRGIVFRTKEVFLLSIFPIVYLVFINSFVVRNDRTLLPMIPFAMILAASFLIHLLKIIQRVRAKTARVVISIFIAAIILSSFIVPVSTVSAESKRLMKIDSRELARLWIEENIPPRTRIAIESYAPFIDPREYDVQGINRLIDYEPTWYKDNHFRYLVFSQGMYGRYYDEPERYPDEVRAYDEMFNTFSLVKLFPGEGYEIRIYSNR